MELHPNSKDPRLVIAKLAQFGFVHGIEVRKRHFHDPSVCKDDDTRFVLYIPMDDEEGGYVVCPVAEHHYGFKKDRFHGAPPKGALIFDIKVSSGEESVKESKEKEIAA